MALHRFPLPAHNIDHEAANCGDPDHCLHEEPTERAYVEFKREPIPWATEPTFITSRAYKQANLPTPTVDLKAFGDALLATGLSAEVLQSLIIIFRHPDEPRKLYVNETGTEAENAELYNCLVGWYCEEQSWQLEQPDDSLVGYDAVLNVVYRADNPAGMNHTLWHEACHMLRHKLGKRSKNYQPLYHRAKWVKAFNRLSPNGAIILWQLDREEFACERFASRHRRIRPISWT